MRRNLRNQCVVTQTSNTMAISRAPSFHRCLHPGSSCSAILTLRFGLCQPCQLGSEVNFPTRPANNNFPPRQKCFASPTTMSWQELCNAATVDCVSTKTFMTSLSTFYPSPSHCGGFQSRNVPWFRFTSYSTPQGSGSHRLRRPGDNALISGKNAATWSIRAYDKLV